MEQYTGLFELYDRMINIDYDAWMSFILECLKQNKVELKGKKILEMACGTGNMTQNLKREGKSVTAFDVSSDMLSIAEEKLRGKGYNVNLLCQNMIDFNINKTFDFIFSFCDGLNYITEDSDIKKCFENVYKHISSGYFMFDISTPYKYKNIIGNNTFTVNEKDICYIWDNYIEDSILLMYITFFVKQGKLYKRIDERHKVKAHEIDFIKDLLLKCGFCDVQVYNDYKFEKINTNSTRAVFIAKKE